MNLKIWLTLRALAYLLGILLILAGGGCPNIPRDERPERTTDTCSKWTHEGVEPCPSLQSGAQPAPTQGN